jgi:hypothetical protein
MKLALAFSLGLNVALAMITWRNSKEQFRALQKPVTSPAVTQIRYEHTPISPPIELGAITNRFQWRMIESRNYEEYVRNLRAVGCPEKTVRDIIVAEVRKTYSARSASVPLATSFWSCGPERQAAERRRVQNQRDLDQESQTLLRHLLGSDLPAESQEEAEDLVEQAILRFLAGPLPDAVFEKVHLVLKQMSDIEQRSNDILLPSEKQQLWNLRQQSLASLQRFLSSAQYDELTRRFAASQLVDHEFRDFQVSGSELREIAGLYAGIYGLPLEAVAFSGNDEEGHTVEQKALFENSLLGFLGETRFAEYKRETDSEFQNIKAFIEQQSLSPEVAIKIYESKTLFDEHSRHLKQAGILSASEIENELQQAQRSMRSAVQQLLGGKSFELYVRQQGGWVTNSTRP